MQVSQLTLDLLMIVGVHEIHNRYQIAIHAYCLMGNHYHLLLCTRLPNLSRAIRHLDGVYTQRYNKLQKTDGPLFRGRFKSIIVGEEDYLMKLSRYIHLNPVVDGLVKKAENYYWSSYGSYLNERATPEWLSTDLTLSLFGSYGQRYTYKTFIEEGVGIELDSFFQKRKRIPILGSETFVKTVSEKYLKDKEICTEIPEQKEMTKMNLPTSHDIIITTAKYYQVDEASLKTSKRKCENKPRNSAIYLAYQLTKDTSKQIAANFTHITATGVLKICERINRRLKEDKERDNEINAIKQQLYSFLLIKS